MGRLGSREVNIYGSLSFEEYLEQLRRQFPAVELEHFQSDNLEELVNALHRYAEYDGIILNPGAYTHTSIAVRDALEASRIPAIEVHLSNVAARDDFRRVSMTAPACVGQITGLGSDGYEWALRALIRRLSAASKQSNS